MHSSQRGKYTHPNAIVNYVDDSENISLTDAVLHTGHVFYRTVRRIEKHLLRNNITLPSIETKKEVAEAFWKLSDTVEGLVKEDPLADHLSAKMALRQLVGPYLLRSDYINRSFVKPHGYAGDYRMIEMMYDLEYHAGNDITQPGIVNCLDYTFSTIHSVQSLWERRHWLSSRIASQYQKSGSNFKVLDIACGGSRYIKDFLSMLQSVKGITITLVDQDPSAIAYSLNYALAEWKECINGIAMPISGVPKSFSSEKFDIVVSAGLFDYLTIEPAQDLLSRLLSLLKPGGIVAITNYHKKDKSAFCKDWFADWRLIFRDNEEIKELFPAHTALDISLSKNESLALVSAHL